VYRNSPFGRSLLDALSDMQSLRQIDAELSAKVLVLFDAAVRKWMALSTQIGPCVLRFWADGVVAFRHVDRQLSIVLRKAQVYMLIEADLYEATMGTTVIYDMKGLSIGKQNTFFRIFRRKRPSFIFRDDKLQ
jgi:hypothetical protein